MAEAKLHASGAFLISKKVISVLSTASGGTAWSCIVVLGMSGTAAYAEQC